MERKIDPDRLRALWDQGVRAAVIAQEFGVHFQAVCKMACRMGLPRRKLRGMDPDRLRVLWEQGLPSSVIAAEFGVAPLSINRAARKLGLPKRERPLPHRKIDPDRLRVLWDQGVRSTVIAAEFGVGRPSVCQMARRMGLPVNRPGRPTGPSLPHVDHDRLREMWAQGVASVRIAAALGCSDHSVRRLARHLGLAPRRGRPRKAVQAVVEAVAVAQSKPLLQIKAAPPPAPKLTARPHAAPLPRVEPLRAAPDPVEVAVKETGGRLAALAAVALAHGITAAKAMQVWHRVRP